VPDVRGLLRSLRTHAWEQGETPEVSGFDFRVLAASAFLFSSGCLTIIGLLVPDYLRGMWLPAYAAVGVACFSLGTITVRVGRISGPGAAGIIFFADVGITIAGLAQIDHSGGRVVTALLTLPTLFIAVFLPWGWLVGQAVLATTVAWWILGLSGDTIPNLVLQTLIIVTSAVCPAVIVLVLRSQLAHALVQARNLATTDPLTGLLNRRGLDQRAHSVVGRARREHITVGVIVADLDHFKRVNDQHGHAVGDTVLVELARTVRSCVRSDDLVVRLGGEEMAVIAVLAPPDLADLAERLRAAVEEEGTRWGVTVSIGVAWRLAAPQADPAELLLAVTDEADDRMYLSKRAGRNRVSLPGGGP